MAESFTPDEPLPGRILIVDDSADGRQTVADLLSLEGFEAVLAANGGEALDVVRNDPPDLVLLDVMMPGMNGMEVLRQIRSDGATSELPVIMVTALDEPHDVVMGLELGANDYLTKPPQYEVLVARVRTQLKIKRLQDQRRKDIIRLRELDALKDKFLQIAAHDLKNPITNVIVGIEVLRRAVSESGHTIPDFDKTIELMTGAAQAMRSIVSDFLDLQAIEAGQINLDLRPVMLNTLVNSVVQQFAAYAHDKHISVTTELDDSIPQTMADPDRLMQVASNLIGNAIKFSPPGTTVVIRTRVADVHLRVEVQDTGPGIPEAELPQLFREFARLSNRPTGGEKSSGLGLSIARQLVELHGGQIGAKSRVGQGSVFWFELPQRSA